MSRRGFGLIELILTLGLFALVSVTSYIFLNQGIGLWRNITETETAGLELQKASHRLRQELKVAAFSEIAVGATPSGLPGASLDGGALWFLSALDPTSEQLVRTPDGTPFWQRNVLYYLVTPGDHRGLYKDDCAGGDGPGGLDDRCPHKILVRKVIDTGVATTPDGDPETTAEALMADATPYLSRPSRFDVSTMAGEPGLEKVEVVASRLLFFRPRLAPDPDWPIEVELDLRAVAIRDAEKHLAVGTASLGEGRFTVRLLESVFPRN